MSGLFGVGGGIITTPAIQDLMGGAPYIAVGTPLPVIIPTAIVHAALGHIDWTIFLVLVIGVVPGARIGAGIALGTHERTLRVMVGVFLLAVSVVYGVSEVVRLTRG